MNSIDEQIEEILFTYKDGDIRTYPLGRARQAIKAIMQQQEQNGVAWSIGVIDDIHDMNRRIDSDGGLNRLFVGLKNTIRDKYEEITGIDPAPNYPITATITPKGEINEHIPSRKNNSTVLVIMQAKP